MPLEGRTTRASSESHERNDSWRRQLYAGGDHRTQSVSPERITSDDSHHPSGHSNSDRANSVDYSELSLKILKAYKGLYKKCENASSVDRHSITPEQASKNLKAIQDLERVNRLAQNLLLIEGQRSLPDFIQKEIQEKLTQGSRLVESYLNKVKRLER